MLFVPPDRLNVWFWEYVSRINVPNQSVFAVSMARIWGLENTAVIGRFSIAFPRHCA